MAINSVFTHECASLVALTVSVVASGDVVLVTCIFQDVRFAGCFSAGGLGQMFKTQTWMYISSVYRSPGETVRM